VTGAPSDRYLEASSTRPEAGSGHQLAEIFGHDAGIPARVAVGMAELPLGAAVETEMTVALRD
jgi:hypothetical protein